MAPDNYFRMEGQSLWVRVGSAIRLDGDEVTLAEIYRDAGYSTAAFISNSMLQRRVGLDAGFDHYDDDLPERSQPFGYL